MGFTIIKVISNSLVCSCTLWNFLLSFYTVHPLKRPVMVYGEHQLNNPFCVSFNLYERDCMFLSWSLVKLQIVSSRFSRQNSPSRVRKSRRKLFELAEGERAPCMHHALILWLCVRLWQRCLQQIAVRYVLRSAALQRDVWVGRHGPAWPHSEMVSWCYEIR